MNVPQVAPHHVQQWLKDGTDHDAVVQMLVASGAWTEDGAHDIVQTFSAEGVAPEDRPFIAINAAWPDGAETVDRLVVEFQAAD